MFPGVHTDILKVALLVWYNNLFGIEVIALNNIFTSLTFDGLLKEIV